MPARRSLTPLVCLLAALGACGPSPSRPEADAAPPARPRDLVLIVVDTLRADRLGCYGHDRDTSPTIDALAARGTRVEQVTAQSSWTAPSMVSMFLSRRVADDFVTMPDPPTLAERLARHGYRTIAFQDNILLAPGQGFERGFEVYRMEAGPRVMGPSLVSDDPRPLFAYFHFVDPHDPYEPLPRFDLFEPRQLGEPARARLETHLRAVAPGLGEDERAARVDAAAARMAEQIAKYDGDVRQADARVAFVIDWLETTGRLDETVVLLTSDHGEGLWQHGKSASELEHVDDPTDPLAAFKGGHSALLYDELIQVPLIVAGPGVPRGLVLPGPAETIDVAPTLFELAGLPVPEAWSGTSLVPAMRAAAAGEPVPGRPATFSNTRLFSAVRTRDGQKLIAPWDPAGPDRVEVFDLTRDPGEHDPQQGPPDARLVELLGTLRASALRAERGEDVIDAEVAERMAQLGYLDDGR